MTGYLFKYFLNVSYSNLRRISTTIVMRMALYTAMYARRKTWAHLGLTLSSTLAPKFSFRFNIHSH